MQPKAEDVLKIKAALQLHYAGLDERIDASIPAYEDALKKANIPYEVYMYDGAQHRFHNDTAPTRYMKQQLNLHGKEHSNSFQSTCIDILKILLNIAENRNFFAHISKGLIVIDE